MPQQNKPLLLAPGELLGKARRSQSRTVDEVADFLKLGKNKIRAMEADQWDLIAPAYRKGFARRYARFLKLSAGELETVLSRITCEDLPVKSIFVGSSAGKVSSLRSLKVLTYLVATVFVVLPLILAYTHFVVRWSQDEPLTQAVNGLDLPQTKGGADLLHLQANMIPAGLTSVTGKPLSADYNTAKLDIELSADSWLSVTDADGRKLESSLRKGGHIYSYKGVAPFELQIGRVSATQVRFNDETVDLQAYTSGDIANLEVGVQVAE